MNRDFVTDHDTVTLTKFSVIILIRSFYANNTRVRYILLSRQGLGINFIQRIRLRSYNDTQFVAVALFVMTDDLTMSVMPTNDQILSETKSNDSHLKTT